MGVEPNNNVYLYMYKECPPLILIGPYLYWRERGWAWSHISRHEENMEFYNYLLWIKSSKNCTLYHVVNKSVWADIGATCAGTPIYWCYLCWHHQYIGATCDGSTNRRRHTDILQLKKLCGFFKCLQRQYVGANWFAAPIYWRSTKRIKMFAAPHLFGQTMPIQSAGVSGSGNRSIPRWRPN